jgi:hypothetical protein
MLCCFCSTARDHHKVIFLTHNLPSLELGSQQHFTFLPIPKGLNENKDIAQTEEAQQYTLLLKLFVSSGELLWLILRYQTRRAAPR